MPILWLHTLPNIDRRFNRVGLKIFKSLKFEL